MSYQLESLVTMHTKTYMPVRITLLSLLLCSVLPAQQAEPKKEEKPAFQLETLYMAIMSKTLVGSTNMAPELVVEQQRYSQGVADTGTLILAGPTSSDESIAGVFVLRVPDSTAALKIANADPLVAMKLWKVALLPWGTQKDYLKPLKKYDPSVTYYLGFLKRGAQWSPEETPERARIQEAHLKNIGRLHEMGKLVAVGPFIEDNDLRGIFVFKTASVEEANQLTNTDPAVQAGRLRIELHEWKLPPG
jgi:uncharacterized protein YciI